MDSIRHKDTIDEGEMYALRDSLDSQVQEFFKFNFWGGIMLAEGIKEKTSGITSFLDIIWNHASDTVYFLYYKEHR